MKDCLFCKIAAGEIPSYKVYEDKDILAFLDIHPINHGHVLVIPKKHSDDMLDTPDELLCKIIKLAKKIGAKIIETGVGEGFNIGINTKKTAGQVVEHFHLHIMPRVLGDGRQLWGGLEFDEKKSKEIIEKLKF